MLLLAHRGASADAPENTLSAFRAAAEQGADGVELDVMVCGSGELVVCHDEVLTRLAGLDWVVANTSWERLKTADVGSHLGFGPERIPLLEEVIDVLPRHMLVNIELKCEDRNDRGLSAKVAAYVRAGKLHDRVVVSSFNPLCLWRTAAADRSIRRGCLIDPDKSFFWQRALVAPLTANFSVHPFFRDCSPERVDGWHAQGRQVAVWTVDDPTHARWLEEMGVDLLITNKPGWLKEQL
jgi:glycerophosphoryl diester phosphodiesterase